MLLTDYFRSTHDSTWNIALQCGVRHGVIRLPEEPAFDICDRNHWDTIYRRFTDFGITPVVIEPMPNALHDHIKSGDALRDEAIEKVLRMLPIMRDLHITTICFNWMAHIGWLRTRSDYPERGGATVTAFDMADFRPNDSVITEKQLWENYAYFLDAVLPQAEACGIRLALHPDDPPIPRLGQVSRIMITPENIQKAIEDIHPSPMLGLTLCQANFHIMGADLEQISRHYAKKVHLIHFRNTTGTPLAFRETFHDNGDIPMAAMLRLYTQLGIDVPIRVDHVPTLAGEVSSLPGYDALGRMFAIGYLKGILDSLTQ